MDEYCSIDVGREYLAHHGVKGMKWGVRKTIERMGVSRQLKKNERSYVKTQRQMLEAVRARNRMKAKGRDVTAVNRQIEVLNKNITSNRKVTNQIIKTARAKGFSVSSNNTRTGTLDYTKSIGAKSAALGGAKSGLIGAATAAAYLGTLATVPITTPAAAIIIGSYALGSAAGGAAKSGALGAAMGTVYGSAVVSSQRKRGYEYADRIFNKNGDVPASILYKRYSVNDLKEWDNYSDYLAHYGVKGMKWGVRKVVERTGRALKRVGTTSVRVAKATARGVYRAGSAVRRFKNRRAIKSGNANKILRRANKMTTQELSDATARVQLLNQIRQNGGHQKTFGDKIVEGLQQKTVDMSKDYLKTSVESVLVKENPLKGIRRDAQVSIAKKNKLLSLNDSGSSAETAKRRNVTVTLNDGTRVTSKSLSINRNIYRVPVKSINNADRVSSSISSKSLTTPISDIYTPRHITVRR